MSVQSEITRLEAAKAAISQAITEKGVDVPAGTMLDAMAPLISAIEAGGGGGGGSPSISVTSKDVNFIDYDGTLLYSYTVAEAQALTELPPLPSHDGLICQGWNYDLATIKEYNRDVTVGAMYITDDGKTRIYIHLEDGRTAPMLGCCPKGTVTVDWGDGSTPETLTGTSVSTVVWTSNHQYASAGDYVITLTVDGTMAFYGENAGTCYSGILRFSSSGDERNTLYHNAVTKIEIGGGATQIGAYAFDHCGSLSSVSIPASVTSIGNAAFVDCYSLKSASIPNGVKTVSGNTFLRCYAFQSVSIPASVTTLAATCFSTCYSLKSVLIPNGVTRILTNFKDCHSLSNVFVPNSITTFMNNSFSYCIGMAYYDFTSYTTVPPLSNSNVFTGIPADCEIRVPAALVDEWKAATNWSTYASQIVGV